MQLSHLLKWHLEYHLAGKKGFVVNREVDVSYGKFIDIQATRPTQDDDGYFDRADVSIEVKGCWHQRLWSAMEAQLKRDYMAQGFTERGVYVVFWFQCGLWTDEHRSKNARRLANGQDFETVAKLLDSQAESLSRDWAQIASVVIDASLDEDWVETRLKAEKKRQARDGVKE